jgi:hypothetical protein
MRPPEKTTYVCQKCGEEVWLDDGDNGREYGCECYCFPVYVLEFDDLPKFWVDTEKAE